MRLLFQTNFKDAPSTELNLEKLKLLGALPGLTFDCFNERFCEYDTVLFMGYDHQVALVKKACPSVKVGVIDPRPSFEKQPAGADFIIANGLEMMDWYRRYTDHVFPYFIHPVLEFRDYRGGNSDKTVIAYHGNSTHLLEIFPRISAALDKLAAEHPLELRALYSFPGGQPLKFGRRNKVSFHIEHIPYARSHYDQYIAGADVGIVPALMPVPHLDRLKKKAATSKKLYNEHVSDHLVRFKATSNPGRIFVFAYFGIPVVTDMFPSAGQVIQHGESGFLCHSTESWYYHLKSLVQDLQLRRRVGKSLQERFQNKYSPQLQNKQLAEFLESL